MASWCRRHFLSCSWLGVMMSHDWKTLGQEKINANAIDQTTSGSWIAIELSSKMVCDRQKPKKSETKDNVIREIDLSFFLFAFPSLFVDSILLIFRSRTSLNGALKHNLVQNWTLDLSLVPHWIYLDLNWNVLTCRIVCICNDFSYSTCRDQIEKAEGKKHMRTPS